MKPFVKQAIYLGIPTVLAALANPFPLLSHLSWYIPFLILAMRKQRFHAFVWLCAFAGLLTDLTASLFPMGAYCLCFTVAGILAFKLKRLLFQGKAVSYFFIGMIYSAIQTVCLYLLFAKSSLQFTWTWVWTDLMVFPALEGFLAALMSFYPLAKDALMRRFFSGQKSPRSELFKHKRPH